MNHKNCNTYKCVQRHRKIQKQRLKRCTRNSEKVGASYYGGSSGAFGPLNDGGVYFARLQSGGTWFARFKPGSYWNMILGKKVVRAQVRDWGSGGGPIGGYPRGVDMHTSLLNALNISDNAVLRVTQHRCK